MLCCVGESEDVCLQDRRGRREGEKLTGKLAIDPPPSSQRLARGLCLPTMSDPMFRVRGYLRKVVLLSLPLERDLIAWVAGLGRSVRFGRGCEGWVRFRLF